jgi:hypothetical protein
MVLPLSHGVRAPFNKSCQAHECETPFFGLEGDVSSNGVWVAMQVTQAKVQFLKDSSAWAQFSNIIDLEVCPPFHSRP